MIKHIDAILLLIFSFLFSIFHIEVITVSTAVIPVIIFLNFIYFLISFKNEISPGKITKNEFFPKLLIISLIFVILFGKSFYNAVKLRHLDPSYPVHDNAIQLESSAKYLFEGKNPYSQKYPELIKYSLWKENPAVYHVITLPFYLIASAFILALTNFSSGYFDERLVHLLVFLPVVFLMWKLRKNLSEKNYLIFLILFFFNPFFAQFFISGRSDVFVFSWLFYCFYSLYIKKYTLASLFFGLAFVSKQSSWLLLPGFFCFIYWKNVRSEKIKDFFKKTWLFFLTVLIFIVPFLLWDFRGFIDGIYGFPAGTLKTSFPIMGYGFSDLLLGLSVVNKNQYFPFWAFQLAFGLPVMIFSLKFLKNSLSVNNLICVYAIFLFIFWFFSRFFLDNYIGFLIMLFLSSALFSSKKS